MPTSAFVVTVPAAEPLVRDLRNRFDATAKLGVPAHITVLYPFMSPDEITLDVLHLAQAALNGVPAFEFSLAGVGRFPATAYLIPQPAEPFNELTTALMERFPAYRPYGGEHETMVPHLTVAHGDAADAHAAAQELAPQLSAWRANQMTCDTVTLIENSSGRWKEMHRFRLPVARLSA